MTTLAIRFYDVVLSLHIMGVVIGFGATFAYPVFASVIGRTEPRGIPAYARAVQVADRFLVIPSMIVILAAGIYLVSDSPIYEFSQFWVSATFAILIVIFAMAGLFFTPKNNKLLEVAERDIAAAGDGPVTMSPEFDALQKQIALAGNIAGLLILIAIFLMAAKPGL